MARLHPQLEPFVESSSDPWDRVKAAHLLNRAGFGGTEQEINRVLEAGPQAAVDELLDFPDGPSDLISATDQPDLSHIEGYPRTFAERRKLFEGKTAEERMLLNQRMNQANQQALRAIANWWVQRMAYGPYPFHEKLTLFWHGHFTTSARDERSAWLMWQQNETWRAHAAGNFGRFVKAVSRDPAMLDYLNNQQNRKARPNENYARELMELFTLGIGNYTENDIKEAARAFTGWAHDGEAFIFRKFDHDDGEKTFFGVRGNFDGDDIIDLILRHKACGPYIASRFWNFFVNEQYDPAVIASLGEVLRENDYELRPMIRTLLTSKAFYNRQNIGSQIKSPIQLVVGTVRLLGVKMPEVNRLNGALNQMGQVPLMPPTVKGWPGGKMWINTSTMFVRYNTVLWLAGGEPVTSGRRVIDAINRRNRSSGIQVEVDGSTEQIVDRWVERLIQRPISEQKRAILIEAIGSEPNESSVRNMVSLILSMPEYQLC
ncbi:MAG: hypothetical protein KatS3mg104_0250 [Phycisphaerae bacterium]|jgi:hypothetical protein|nr:MAG: hypothetical protein KatS3mg104_0250 [Phycisphaerae bacterium]